MRVLETIFDDRIRFIIEPQENPFRAVTYYHEEGKREQSWSCSSTHLYGIQGWKEDDIKMGVKEVRENLKGKGNALL